MITEEKINRINELSRKSKTEGLTEKEKIEQKKLRDEYIKAFRDNLKAQLENIEIVDPQMEDEIEDEVLEVIEEIDHKKNIN